MVARQVSPTTTGQRPSGRSIMPFLGFEGPAGTGKTHRLIEAVRVKAGELQMQPHNRILPLTFLQGSRRRLEEPLAQPAATHGRLTSMPNDPFPNPFLPKTPHCP